MNMITYSIREIILFYGLMICASINAFAANCNLNTEVHFERKLIKWPQITQQTSITPELWVSVDDIKQWTDIDNVFWLDVRQKSKVDKFPLYGALAISLENVQDRLFLKHKPIVLIGDGFDQIELEQTSIKLKKAGFKFVYALIDGIRADFKKLNHLLSNFNVNNELTPEEFLMASRVTQWNIITWDLDPEEIQKIPVKIMEQWGPSDASLSEFSQYLQSITKNKQQNNSLSKTLIITKDSKANQRLQKLLQTSTYPYPLFWIKGGMNYYQHFIEQQNKILMNMETSLQSKCNDASIG